MIDQNGLISMLKVPTQNQLEYINGWNAAIITLLKTAKSPSPIGELCKKHLRGYDKMSEINISELVSFIRDGSKLAAVKYYKDITGMGLRESKDDVDILSTEL